MRHLSGRDVVALLQLAGEVGELPFDPQARRAHLLNGLLSLVGGIHAQASEADVSSPERFGLALPGTTTQVGGMDDWQLEAMEHYIRTDDPARDPCVPLMFRAEGKVVVRRRAQMMDDSWYRSDHYNLFRRSIGAGESLYCHLRPSDGRYFRIGIIREPNDRAFSDRDVQVMRVFHENLARLYLAPHPSQTPQGRGPDPQLAALPPRVQPVLRGFLDGDGEKQIARRLGLSRYTVHEYAKLIYRTLGVTTRAELLARFVQR